MDFRFFMGKGQAFCLLLHDLINLKNVLKVGNVRDLLEDFLIFCSKGLSIFLFLIAYNLPYA